jgi:hypothetical protein
MQYYHNNKPVKFFGVQKRCCGKPDIAKIQHLAPGAMIVSIPFSELTTTQEPELQFPSYPYTEGVDLGEGGKTQLTEGELMHQQFTEADQLDRKFYDWNIATKYYAGPVEATPFPELSQETKDVIRKERLMYENTLQSAQLTEGYNPTFNKFCKDLIDLLFPEGEREGVGNVDTILEKVRAEMDQLADYRKMNAAKINAEFEKLEEFGQKMQSDQLWDAKNQSGGYSYLEWMKREGWDINLVHTEQGAKLKEYNEWLAEQVEYLTPQLTEVDRAVNHIISIPEHVYIQKTEDEIRREKYSHYYKNVKGLDYVDVYRVLELFSVSDQAIGHAVKKLLCAGSRGAKDRAKDVAEAIVTLQRRQEMDRENG